MARQNFSIIMYIFCLRFCLRACILIAPENGKAKKMTKQEYAILFIFGAAVIVAALNIDALMVM